jgi:hypothetical protein
VGTMTLTSLTHKKSLPLISAPPRLHVQKKSRYID